MKYVLTRSIANAGVFAYAAGSSFVIQNVFGASPQLYGIIFATNGLGMMASSRITGHLAGRIRETRLFTVGLGIVSAGSLVLLATILTGASLLVFLVPLFVVVAGGPVISTAASSLAMQDEGRAAGSASAIIRTMPAVCGAVAAPLAGLGGAATALPMGLVIVGANGAAIACYAILRAASNATPRRSGPGLSSWGCGPNSGPR